MKLSIKELRQIVKEELKDVLDHNKPEDVEAKEKAWSGGKNLVNQVKHKAYGIKESDDLADHIAGVCDEDCAECADRGLCLRPPGAHQGRPRRSS